MLCLTHGVRKGFRFFHMWVSSYCSSIHWCECCFLVGWCYRLLQSSWPHTYDFLFLTLFYRTPSGLFFCNCHFEEPMRVTVPLKQSLKSGSSIPQTHSLFQGYLATLGLLVISHLFWNYCPFAEERKSIWDFVYICNDFWWYVLLT